MASIVFLATFSTVPRTFAMAKALAEKGHKVTLVEWDRERTKPSLEVKEGVRFKRLRLAAPYGRKASLLLAVWEAYVFIHLLAHRYDIVQAQNLDNLIPAYLACRLGRMAVVYDLADFYADSYVAGVPVIGALCRNLERKLARSVNGLILVSEKQITQLGAANMPQLWAPIYNSPDIRPRPCEKEREANTKLRLFHGGTLGKGRRKLLNVIKVVKELDTVELLIAGFGEYEQLVKNSSNGLPNVKFLGKASHREIMRLTAAADVIVIPLNSAYRNFRIALPNKLFEALALGKPVLVPKDTYMADLCSKLRFGLSVDYDKVNEIRSAILLLQDKAFRFDLCRNATSAYQENYSWDRMKNRLLALYRQVLAQRSTSR